MERTRHVILLREKLAEQNKTHELSKLDKEIVNRQAKVENQRLACEVKSEVKQDENPKDVDEKEKCESLVRVINRQESLELRTEGDPEKELQVR